MMARATTKDVTNASVTAKPQRVAGIRLADSSKLVGVLFGSDMVTVLGFVLQNAQGGNSIETVREFASRVRISDYVDEYGRCAPKKFREFQARNGSGLPFSRVLKSDNMTGGSPDPKQVTTELLNQLLSACAFVPMPDYAMVQGVIRRASTTEDANNGKCVDNEGLMGLALLLHYPDLRRKKRVKDPTGQVRVVPVVVKEHTIRKFLPAYDAYSLPFEVKKYAVKRTSVKTSIGASTPLYNYYVSIKKEGLPLFHGDNPTELEKATMLLDRENTKDYSPAFDPAIVQAMYLQQKDIENFRKNGVYIKGTVAASIADTKVDFTAADLFDMDDTDEGEVAEAVAPETAEIVGDAPSGVTSEEDAAEASDAAVTMDNEAEAESAEGMFDGVTFVDAPVVESDGDLSTPIGSGITLPDTVLAQRIGKEDAKILVEARNKWEALCDMMQEAADALCNGSAYNYDGASFDTMREPKLPVAFGGSKRLIYENKGERKVSVVFGDTKKGSSYPLLTLNSINIKITRHFYADVLPGQNGEAGVEIPVESNLSYDTITLYAFDGKPKNAKGFSINLPNGGGEFTSSTIHTVLKKISDLMRSLSDGVKQTNLIRTFLNAGLAATWRQTIKDKRKELGLNTAAVAKAESMELRVRKAVEEKQGSNAADLIPIVYGMLFGEEPNRKINLDSFKKETIPYDPITSEFREGGGATYTEYTTGKNVARALDDLKAEEEGTPDYKMSASKQVQGFISSLKSKENGTKMDDKDRLAYVANLAAEEVVEGLKGTTEVSPDFDWASYKLLKAEALRKAGEAQIGKSQTTKSASSDYALSFDMHLGAEDVAAMQASGIALSEESPILVNANEKLDSNVKAMVLWLLGTVDVGQNTNDGLQFDASPYWTDKSKAARAGAATRTSSYEYRPKTPDGKEIVFGASLKRPV